MYDQFPKSKNYLFLSGSSISNSGTFVSVKDAQGSTFADLAATNSNDYILDFKNDSVTIEFWFFAPTIANSNQIILQKYDSSYDNGVTLALSNSVSTANANIILSVSSGSSKLNSEISASKGEWNHFAFVWDREETENNIKIYLNGNYSTKTENRVINSLNFYSSNLYIGSGSSTTNFVPTSTLSGAIDELRIWKKKKTQEEILKEFESSVFKQDNLLLYYKFNEPSGSNTDIIIDYSGNSLHGVLSDDAFTKIKTRNIPTASIAEESPVICEPLWQCPILFPDNADIVSLQETFLLSASLYDSINPNLITRLIPKHYFLEGQIANLLETEDGEITTTLISSSLAQNISLGQTQVLSSLLYVWATFFDELKLFMDGFGNLNKLNYSNEDTIPDQFLIFLSEKYGIQLPPLFIGSSIEQFIEGTNLSEKRSVNDFSIQYIQNQIWKRILINLKDIIGSKGTINSVKSFIRATGIDPDNNFRIREYGGPTKRQLKNSRERKSEASTVLNFISGGYIKSPFLVSERTEPGYPEISNTGNDTLLTSGSWSFEGIYILNKTQQSQSLARICLQETGSSDKLILANLVAVSGSGIDFYLCVGTSSNVLSMSVSGFDPMDGQDWYVSFGRKRNDDDLNSNISSSYFLRAARSDYGNLADEVTSEAWFDDSSINYFQTKNDIYGEYSGSFIEIGSGSITNLSNKNLFLNSLGGSSISENFNGKLSQLRFWSKALDLDEWREHVRNFKSLGVRFPRKNYNFENKETGSFGKIRLDISTDQQNLLTDGSGDIELFDFSQNNFHFSGSDFPETYKAIVPHRFFYSHLSPKIDEAVTDNKVRIRSFLNFNNVLNNENDYAQQAPVYDIEPNETPQDSTKFSIDFSIVDSLNQDIVSMFSTFEEFDSAIGDPTLLYSPDYPTLDNLKNIYFNRLTKKMNLKSFFEFYKWFDTNIGNFIAQLLPMKTQFKGTNFVIEQHILERSKFEYHSEDIYLGDNSRHSQKSPILLQLLVGQFQRY